MNLTENLGDLLLVSALVFLALAVITFIVEDMPTSWYEWRCLNDRWANYLISIEENHRIGYFPYTRNDYRSKYGPTYKADLRYLSQRLTIRYVSFSWRLNYKAERFFVKRLGQWNLSELLEQYDEIREMPLHERKVRARAIAVIQGYTPYDH